MLFLLIIILLLMMGASSNRERRENGQALWLQRQREDQWARNLQEFSRVSAETAENLRKLAESSPNDAYLQYLTDRHVPDTFPSEWS